MFIVNSGSETCLESAQQNGLNLVSQLNPNNKLSEKLINCLSLEDQQKKAEHQASNSTTNTEPRTANQAPAFHAGPTQKSSQMMARRNKNSQKSVELFNKTAIR